MADKAPIAGQKIKRKFMVTLLTLLFRAQRKQLMSV